MELYQKVLLAIVILIILYVILGYIFPNNTKLSSMKDAKKEEKIDISKLPSNSNSINFTYSVWIYVEDWNYKFGNNKVILAKYGENKSPSPSISLGGFENNLEVALNCYDKKSNKNNIHNCSVNNIPLQKWVNIITSVYGNTLDIYIDGKLVRTCLLPGVPKIPTSSPIIITPSGGFDGWTSNIEFLPNSSNPQEAYDIYKSGNGDNLGGFFNKYKLKIALMDDNNEKGSIQI